MKILILSSNLSNEAGGYSESSFLLRERLENVNNNKVYLFGFWKSKFLKLNYNQTNKINIFLPGILNKFPFSYKYLKKIFFIKPEIIDVQGIWSSTSIFNLVYHLFSKTPYIVTPRGMLQKWAVKQSFLKKKIFYFFIEKIHLKFATCLRATSDIEAMRFKELGFKKIITIPNSIKIPKLKINLKNKNRKKKKIIIS